MKTLFLSYSIFKRENELVSLEKRKSFGKIGFQTSPTRLINLAYKRLLTSVYIKETDILVRLILVVAGVKEVAAIYLAANTILAQRC